MKKFLTSLFFLSIFIVTFSTQRVFAAEGIHFSVQATIPENQVDKKATYFDLRMKPSQEQTVEVVVTNGSDEDITVEHSLHTAVTNSNGAVEYNNTTIENDKSLKFDLEKFATVEKETVIPANSKKAVPITIKMPAESFDGVLLGGIHFSEKEADATTDSSEEKSSGIKNKVGYTIALQLSETDKKIEPNINLTKVEPGLNNYRNAIIASIQNDQSVIIKGLSLKGTVYKKGSDKPLYSSDLDANMAPNSTMDFPIMTNNAALKAGTYTCKIEAVSGDKKWNYSKNFTIKSTEAKKLNADAVEVTKDYSSYYIMAIVAAVIILGAVIIFLIIKLKKVNKKK